MPLSASSSSSAKPRIGDFLIPIAMLLYGLGVMALIWINPQSRLHPLAALAAFGRGLEGEWQFPWQHVHALAIFALTLLTAEALGWLSGITGLQTCISPPSPESTDHPPLPIRSLAFPGALPERLLAGYVLLGLIMFLLGIAGLYRAPVFWGFSALVILARWASRWRTNAGASKPAEKSNGPTIHTKKNLRWDWIIIFILLLPIAAYALTPPIQSDGIRYHLAALQEYLKAGGIVYLPFNAFSNLPFLVEMIFLLPLGLGSDAAAQLTHLSFLVIAAELVFRLTTETVKNFRLAVERSPLPGLLRAAMLGFPVMVIVAAWPFVDAALLAFFLAMLLMLLRWLREPEAPRPLLWCGFFAGACLATKYTMVVFAGLTALIVLLFFAQHRRQFIGRLMPRHILLFFALMALVAAPWYVKNLIHTGNPVYPLANGIFRGGEWGEASARLYAAKAGAKGLKSPAGFVAAPLLSSVSWTPIPGAEAWFARLNYEDHFPGPLFLMLLPLAIGAAAAMFWQNRRKLWVWHYRHYAIIAFAAAFYVFWFFTYQSNRFLLPLFALTLWGAALALDFWRPHLRAAVVLIFLIGAAGAYGYAWSLEWMFARTRVAPLPYLLGFQSREDYVAAALPHTRAFRALEALAAPGEKALFVGEYRGYHSRAPYIANDFFDQPVILDYLRRANLDAARLRETLRGDGVRFILLNWAELQLYLSDFRSFFSPEEWRAFENFLNAPWLLKRAEDPPGCMIYEISNP